MYSHLTLILFNIFYLILHIQCADNTTVVTTVVVQNTTVVQTTAVIQNTTAVVQNITVVETTIAPTTEYTTVISTEIPSIVNTTYVLPKTIGSSYVEPPPHPLGYCIRSRIMCSKIRRCCRGPCNLNNMRCP